MQPEFWQKEPTVVYWNNSRSFCSNIDKVGIILSEVELHGAYAKVVTLFLKSLIGITEKLCYIEHWHYGPISQSAVKFFIFLFSCLVSGYSRYIGRLAHWLYPEGQSDRVHFSGPHHVQTVLGLGPVLHTRSTRTVPGGYGGLCWGKRIRFWGLIYPIGLIQKMPTSKPVHLALWNFVVLMKLRNAENLDLIS